MERYLVFAGDTYYPGGGWDDFIGDFASTAEAYEAARASKCSWWQVIDSFTKTEMKEITIEAQS